MLFRMERVKRAVLNFDDTRAALLSPEETRTMSGLQRVFVELSLNEGTVRNAETDFIPARFDPPNRQQDAEEFYTEWLGLLRKLQDPELNADLFLSIQENSAVLKGARRGPQQEEHAAMEHSQPPPPQTEWNAIQVRFPNPKAAVRQPVPLDRLLLDPQGPFGDGIVDAPEGIVSRHCRILRLPRMIAISFVRKIMNRRENYKIEIPVDVPAVLDMSPFLEDASVAEQISTVYELHMFVHHTGGANSGHYTAYVKTDGQWLLLNDSHVSKVSDHEALRKAQTASLCFYRQL